MNYYENIGAGDVDNVLYSPVMQNFNEKKSCIYYDADMALLRKQFKDLRNTFDAIEKRYIRHETVQLAKSIFDYCSQKDEYFQFPQHYYDYRSGDVRICIARYRHEYYIKVFGWKPSISLYKYVHPHGFGSFPTPQEALGAFNDFVHDFTSEHLSALF